MLAILGGLAAALCWATSSMASARASRLVGSWATLGWVMLIGTLVTVPLTILFGSGADLTPDAITLLVISGAANVVGLLFAYSAFRRGQVAVVRRSVHRGRDGGRDRGRVRRAGRDRRRRDPDGRRGRHRPRLERRHGRGGGGGARRARGQPSRLARVGRPRAPGSTGSALLFALAGVVCFGINLYASARIGSTLPLVWSVMPARLGGFLFVALPMLVTGRLRLTRPRPRWSSWSRSPRSRGRQPSLRRP